MHTLAICFMFWSRQRAYWHTQTMPHLSHNLPLPSQFSHQYQVILFGDSGTRCEHLAQGAYTAVSNQGVKRVTTWSQERCPAARRSKPLRQNIMHINDEKNMYKLNGNVPTTQQSQLFVEISQSPTATSLPRSVLSVENCKPPGLCWKPSTDKFMT